MSRKPNCSYNCLIGMALKSSSSGRLPVGEIYRFFEREFPYFLTATEPWKNSLRHSLSLGHYFRKFNSDRMMTKKGHLWEVEPHKAAELDKEIYMFLAKAVPAVENLPNTSQLSILQAQMAHIYLDSANSKSSTPFTGTILSTPGYFTPTTPENCTQNTIQFPNSIGCHSGFAGNIPDSPASSTISTSATAISRTKSHATLKYDKKATNATKLDHSPQGSFTRVPKPNDTSETPTKFNQNEQIPLVSEEALQLIQFCNHCSFELSVNSPESNTLSQKDENGHNKAMESSEQIEDVFPMVSLSSPSVLCEEELDNTYYPFITEPREDCNVTLAKLNGGGYRTEPGAPRELHVKKCLRGKRMNGTLRKNSASLENAIRPVTSTWNSWWKREYTLLLMNDDMATGCYTENQSREISVDHSTRKPYWHSARRKLQYPVLVPAKPSRLEHPSVMKSGSGKITCEALNKSEDKKSPQKCLIDLREKLTRKKMASIYANLRLIISIPFHKIIIQRKVGRNYKEGKREEGGKHRIFTGALQ